MTVTELSIMTGVMGLFIAGWLQSRRGRGRGDFGDGDIWSSGLGSHGGTDGGGGCGGGSSGCGGGCGGGD